MYIFGPDDLEARKRAKTVQKNTVFAQQIHKMSRIRLASLAVNVYFFFKFPCKGKFRARFARRSIWEKESADADQKDMVFA